MSTGGTGGDISRLRSSSSSSDKKNASSDQHSVFDTLKEAFTPGDVKAQKSMSPADRSRYQALGAQPKNAFSSSPSYPRSSTTDNSGPQPSRMRKILDRHTHDATDSPPFREDPSHSGQDTSGMRPHRMPVSPWSTASGADWEGEGRDGSNKGAWTSSDGPGGGFLQSVMPSGRERRRSSAGSYDGEARDDEGGSNGGMASRRRSSVLEGLRSGSGDLQGQGQLQAQEQRRSSSGFTGFMRGLTYTGPGASEGNDAEDELRRESMGSGAFGGSGPGKVRGNSVGSSNSEGILGKMKNYTFEAPPPGDRINNPNEAVPRAAALDTRGSIGREFTTEGKIGSTADKLEGPFREEGFIGKQFTDRGAIGGRVQDKLGHGDETRRGK